MAIKGGKLSALAFSALIDAKAAFENAMALDVSMGGSTNTVQHRMGRDGGDQIGIGDRRRIELQFGVDRFLAAQQIAHRHLQFFAGAGRRGPGAGDHAQPYAALEVTGAG